MHGTCCASKAFLSQPLPAHSGLGGHIVNVSSLGAVAPVQGVSLYQAAKAGCRTFSIAAAKVGGAVSALALHLSPSLTFSHFPSSSLAFSIASSITRTWRQRASSSAC